MTVIEQEFVSNLAPAPKVTRRPADRLGERRVLMRRFGAGRPPSIAELVAHAERYGVEAVVQTAAECGHGVDACVRLQDACDRIEAAAHRREYPKAPAKKFPDPEKRVRELLGIEEDED